MTQKKILYNIYNIIRIFFIILLYAVLLVLLNTINLFIVAHCFIIYIFKYIKKYNYKLILFIIVVFLFIFEKNLNNNYLILSLSVVLGKDNNSDRFGYYNKKINNVLLTNSLLKTFINRF